MQLALQFDLFVPLKPFSFLDLILKQEVLVEHHYYLHSPVLVAVVEYH